MRRRPSTESSTSLVCTDPPYYDNIGYADLSDFFYVWLRRSLGDVYPDLFSTLLTPKAQELVATPYRFDGDRRRADEFFEDGLRAVFRPDARRAAPGLSDDALLRLQAGRVDATERSPRPAGTRCSTGFSTPGSRSLGRGRCARSCGRKCANRARNALASSIVLVCRPRPVDAPIATRREFVAALRAELPAALTQLQHGNIAPVDLAQAAIGPGMAVFSRYAKVRRGGRLGR